MTTQITPFADTSNFVITDTHGNELNVQTDKEQLVIYGQWQGKKEAPEFVSFVNMLKKAQEILTKDNISSTKEIDGFNVKKKKDELLIDVNVTLEKNEQASGQILKFINKVNKLKS